MQSPPQFSPSTLPLIFAGVGYTLRQWTVPGEVPVTASVGLDRGGGSSLEETTLGFLLHFSQECCGRAGWRDTG